MATEESLMVELLIKVWECYREQQGTAKHPGAHAAGSLCHLGPEEASSFAVPGSGKHSSCGGGAGDKCYGLSGGKWPPPVPCSKVRREPRRLKSPTFFFSPPLWNVLLLFPTGLGSTEARKQGSPSDIV